RGGLARGARRSRGAGPRSLRILGVRTAGPRARARHRACRRVAAGADCDRARAGDRGAGGVRCGLTRSRGRRAEAARSPPPRAVAVDARIGPPALPGVPGPLARDFGPAAAGVPKQSAALGDTLHRQPAVRVLWPPRTHGVADSSALVRLAARADNAAGLVLEI